jgi:putative oxidoreductase
VLRLALGVVFVAHGVKHFVNREKTISWTESIGFRNPGLQWMFMTFAEVGVGVGLLAGILTGVSAAGLVAMMTVAFVTVHRAAGFWITARPDEGWEYVFVLSLGAVTLALVGPGEWSVDHVLGIAATFDEWVGLGLVGGGVVAALAQLAVFLRRPDTPS